MNKLLTTYPVGCSRQEMAKLIFPDYSTTAAAVARLGRWINSDPEVLRALNANGYRKGVHWFTPRIIRVLERFFL